jgi:hypothetical protein
VIVFIIDLKFGTQGAILCCWVMFLCSLEADRVMLERKGEMRMMMGDWVNIWVDGHRGVEDNVCVDSTDHLTLNAGQLVIRRALVV